ncbi:hypothetical protein C1645_813944 [Glomus cerebriforme]|uniref:TLDc domain-containing protein n=1 Tax=Glomus cerebriforme TaxID=658196 RepID=A0A397THY4_9GLOM|nr:hypothetical protein C1645_813944 [Glomus cerebriforme]
MSDETGIELLNIMIASNELKLKQILKLAEDFIIAGNHQYLRNDPIGILQMVIDHKIFVNVKEFYLEAICSDPKILFDSDKFTQLSAPTLEIILKRNDLKLDEIVIWENLVKWEILCKFVPFIRFYGISSKDYIIKIKPYEEILPKELKEDLFKYYMIPEYKPTLNILSPRYSKIIIDSIIINQQHTVLFANWIDQKGKNSRYIKTIPYEFNLIYRASRDGWAPTAFHDKCDNKESTITIAKIKNSEHIVGGYNPLQWDSSDTHKSTKDSFIFSFTNRKSLQSAKLGNNTGDAYSIGCYLKNGPLFGSDLVYHNNGNWKSTNPFSYFRIDIPTSFRVDDYEVFQVINKKTGCALKKETKTEMNDKNLGREEIVKNEKNDSNHSIKEDKKGSFMSLFKGKK